MCDTPFPMALPAPAGEVVTLTRDLMQAGIEQSRLSPRRRIIQPLHKSDEAVLHRMFNVMQPGTYIRPHWHRDPPKDETLVVLQGKIAAFVYRDDGEVRDVITLSAGSASFGIDFVAGVCHSFVVLASDTVVFEVKPGPYVRLMDKDFAPWAPAEGDPEAVSFLQRLENACT